MNSDLITALEESIRIFQETPVGDLLIQALEEIEFLECELSCANAEAETLMEELDEVEAELESLQNYFKENGE